MEEKVEDVVKQYPIQLIGKRRIRGAVLLEAKEGVFSLVRYKESAGRLAFQEQIKQSLILQGYRYVDEGIPNNANELLTRDAMGNDWLLKRWYQGKECNLRDEEEICKATQHLANLHLKMVCTGNGTDEIEGEAAAVERDLQILLERHTREMKRVYNYIRSKKRKNEMEICILNLFQRFYDQAGFANVYLSEIDYHSLLAEAAEEKRVYHGSYTYHNILFREGQIITTNFDKADVGIQIVDFYDFLRKILEKNGWNIRQGIRLLELYQRIRPLEKREAKLLYILFLFPEKFWKQINFYYNGKKSWMSVKNYEKLLKIASQEEARRNFLKEAKGLLF